MSVIGNYGTSKHAILVNHMLHCSSSRQDVSAAKALCHIVSSTLLLACCVSVKCGFFFVAIF